MTYVLIIWFYTQSKVMELGGIDLATCESYQEQVKLWPDKDL
jgi:hypothetical protein